MKQQSTVYSHPIVFYDGNCLLCSRSVGFIIKHEQSPSLLFAPLQGDTFLALSGKEGKEEQLKSLVIYDKGQLLEESEAVFKVLTYLKLPLSWLAALRILPLSVTNFCYRFVARNRYKWFGEAKQNCFVDHDKSRFLP